MRISGRIRKQEAQGAYRTRVTKDLAKAGHYRGYNTLRIIMISPYLHHNHKILTRIGSIASSGGNA